MEDSEKEVDDLWRLFKISGCEEARAELLYFYSGFVAALASKVAPTRELFPDLYQEGIVALIKCIDQFDLNRGVRFMSYAFPRIKGAMINFLVRNEFKFPMVLEDDRISCILEERELGEVELRLERQELLSLLERLPRREGEVIRSWYLMGMNPKDIAKRLGVALSHVYRLRSRALVALRKMLEEG